MEDASENCETPLFFVCYAHPDAQGKEELCSHLTILTDQNILRPWSDEDIELGEEWESEIQKALRECSAAFLILSPEFFTKDFIKFVELPKLLDRHKKGEILLFPIVWRDCLWQQTRIGNLQAFPPGGRGRNQGIMEIERRAHRDQLWTRLAQRVAEAIANVRAGRPDTISNCQDSLRNLTYAELEKRIKLSNLVYRTLSDNDLNKLKSRLTRYCCVRKDCEFDTETPFDFDIRGALDDRSIAHLLGKVAISALSNQDTISFLPPPTEAFDRNHNNPENETAGPYANDNALPERALIDEINGCGGAQATYVRSSFASHQDFHCQLLAGNPSVGCLRLARVELRPSGGGETTSDLMMDACAVEDQLNTSRAQSVTRLERPICLFCTSKNSAYPEGIPGQLPAGAWNETDLVLVSLDTGG